MNISKPIAVLAAIAVFASVAWADTAPPILKQIPSGSLGFVAINNVKATAARVDQFITDIGVGKFVPPGGVLSLMKGAVRLGPGFNADGGMALAVLDPQQFELDLAGLITGKPGAKEPKPNDIPVVVFVPGSGVKEVFGDLAKPDGKYFLVTIEGVPTVATHRNGYVVLSPCQAAVEAVVSARKTAAGEMSKDHAAVIAKADMAYCINMKVAGPIVNAALKKYEKEIENGMGGGPFGPMPFNPAAILNIYRKLIAEMDTITVTARLESKGVAVDMMLSFSPDSLLTKIAAAFPGTVKPNVARLANLPYVMAIGSLAEKNKEARKFADDMTADLFGKNMPKELRDLIARMQKVGAGTDITSFQFVAGGAPQGKGVFGLAALIECKDPKAVKKMLVDVAGVIEKAIKSIDPNDENIRKLKIAYSSNIETIGTIAVDAIVVTHPDLDDLGAPQKAEMKKVLGEDKILIRVAAIDGKTVVMTFGGSSAFLAETVKAAKLGGRIVSRRDAARLARHMPAKPTGFMLFSVGNLFEVINTGMRVFDPNSTGMDVKIATKDPVVISGGYTGKASHVIIYVPTKLIKDVVAASDAGGGMPPQPPDGDF